MSRLFVRRSAAMVLLAVLCLALPAAAAAPARPAKAPAHSLGLVDNILLWIGHFWGGSSPAGTAGQAKVTTSPSTTTSLSGVSTDLSGGLDPNGHS